MSERSIRRANERRAAKQRRAQALRRRRTGVATGAVIGAAAIFAPAAQALEVTSLADGAADACDSDCKLRDAVEAANTTAGPDEITFASSLSGQIVLTEGDLPITTDELTITGPGEDVLSISGDNDANGPDDGDFRIFTVAAEATISGLTLTEGGAATTSSSTGPGGAVYVSENGDLTIVDSTLTANRSGDRGGSVSAYGDVELLRTVVSESTATEGAGVNVASGGSVQITDSTVSDNDATQDGGGVYVAGFGGPSGPGVAEIVGTTISGNTAGATRNGAGIANVGTLTVRESTITGNTGPQRGGGVYSDSKYQFELADSIVTGNEAEWGGGVYIRQQDDGSNPDALLSGATISGNTAEYGGGLYVGGVQAGRLTVAESTLSGNEASVSGGGVYLYSSADGDVRFSNSTIADNTAPRGSGASFTASGGGIVELANSTVAANRDSAGLYLGSYEADATRVSRDVRLTSTIVANHEDGDLDQADDAEAGGFDLAFSLVETPGDATVFQGPGVSNILGSDPQLGALGDNGGSTPTMVPAQSSPAIDQGDAPPTAPTDQRGGPRTLDGAPANPSGGDGTDIGAVEIDAIPAPPPARQQPTTTPPPGGSPPPGVFRRVTPGGIRFTVTPRRDRRPPFTFRTRGQIVPPGGMTAAQACGTVGIVSILVKRGGATISSRRALVRADCTFSSKVSFRSRKRFGTRRRLKFVVRFGGNQALEPAAARPVVRRVR